MQDVEFLIIGGGILGAAIASIAAAKGRAVAVLRMSDFEAPQADTLRNQGWLQSGLIYPLGAFKKFENSDAVYAASAFRTYYGARSLLERCGLSVPDDRDRGIVRASADHHVEALQSKAKLLRLSQDEFRELEADEIKDVVGAFAEPNSRYFYIPDSPFDEAGVLRYLRKTAEERGALFAIVEDPVTLQNDSDGVRVCYRSEEWRVPFVVVTAGAGSFDLVRQVGGPLEGFLRRTPLLVSDAPAEMPSSLVVDLERGYSAVRHECEICNKSKIVVGTREHQENAPFAPAASRQVTTKERESFEGSLPKFFHEGLETGRFTAGYEVMPNETTGLTAYDPWVVETGRVIFASPGRATISLRAAELALASINLFQKKNGRAKARIDLGSLPRWDNEVLMHYTARYEFNDWRG